MVGKRGSSSARKVLVGPSLEWFINREGFGQRSPWEACFFRASSCYIRKTQKKPLRTRLSPSTKQMCLFGVQFAKFKVTQLRARESSTPQTLSTNLVTRFGLPYVRPWARGFFILWAAVSVHREECSRQFVWFSHHADKQNDVYTRECLFIFQQKERLVHHHTEPCVCAICIVYTSWEWPTAPLIE